jgi:hypothetical protein
MQYRVQNIKDQFTKLNIAYDEMKKEILFTKIKSIFHPTLLETPVEEVLVNEIEPRKKSHMEEIDVNTSIEKVILKSHEEEIKENTHTKNEMLEKLQISEDDDYDMEKRIKEIEYALQGKTLPDEKKPYKIQHKEEYKEGSIGKFLQDNGLFTIKVVSDTEYIVGAHNSPMNGIVKFIDNEWTVVKWL